MNVVERTSSVVEFGPMQVLCRACFGSVILMSLTFTPEVDFFHPVVHMVGEGRERIYIEPLRPTLMSTCVAP